MWTNELINIITRKHTCQIKMQELLGENMYFELNTSDQSRFQKIIKISTKSYKNAHVKYKHMKSQLKISI